jgi:hypothetical protein
MKNKYPEAQIVFSAFFICRIELRGQRILSLQFSLHCIRPSHSKLTDDDTLGDFHIDTFAMHHHSTR